MTGIHPENLFEEWRRCRGIANALAEAEKKLGDGEAVQGLAAALERHDQMADEAEEQLAAAPITDYRGVLAKLRYVQERTRQYRDALPADATAALDSATHGLACLIEDGEAPDAR